MSDNLQQILDSVKTLQTEAKRERRQYLKKMLEYFSTAAKEVFEVVPEVKAIIWTQYTPYFNDGEECVFSLGDVVVTNFDDEELSNVYSDWYGGKVEGYEVELGDGFTGFGGNKLEKQKAKLISEFCKFIAAEEELMQNLFGDHVKVIITACGIYVEEYDHD